MDKRMLDISKALLAGIVLFGLLSGIAPQALGAVPGSAVPPGYHFGFKYIGNLVLDFKEVVVSPAHWRGKDWLLFGGTAALTGLLYAYDGNIGDWVLDHRSLTSSGGVRFMSHLAEPPFMLGLIATMYASGEIFKKPGLRRTALLSLEAYVINAGISSAIKFVVGRSRYEIGEGPHRFHPFSFHFAERSFPSGHSGSIFSVAAIIAGESDNWAVGALAYGLAGVVALSRLHDMDHWASDILAGSALGYFIGKMVRHLNPLQETGGPRLVAGFGPNRFSLALQF